MRGKPASALLQTLQTRNIPAYAGKTEAREIMSEAKAEHPRVCGENLAVVGDVAGPPGTSPRMRGKHF